MNVAQFDATVVETREIAVDVHRIVLEYSGLGDDARWSPGAHIDIFLPDGEARQYSLAGSPGDDGRFVVGILLEREGRGGSRWITESATPGARLTISAPRNHFAYRAEATGPVVFVAGGIGITPILPMLARAEADGTEWELHYVGRSLEHMAFRDELAAYGDRIHLYPRDTAGRPHLESILLGRGLVTVYCCGPEALMASVEDLGRMHDDVNAHVERFVPRPVGPDRGVDDFDVRFEYSDVDAHVGPGETILEVAERAGIDVPTSCREGTCGTCETPLMDGTVVHLDSVLSDDEREASETVMICISRATCPRLVLDL